MRGGFLLPHAAQQLLRFGQPLRGAPRFGFAARALGFDVVVLEDAVRAVDVQPGDGMRALAEMAARGARIAAAGQVLA